jgi:aminopeptidase YwaD
MGVMPDYTYTGTGMHIDAVIDGRPASKAGVKNGDTVIKMGERIITDLNDYMKALSLFKKGQTIEIIVLRDKNELKLNLTFNENTY